MITDNEYKLKYMDLRRKKLLRKVLILQNTFKAAYNLSLTVKVMK